MITVVPSYYSRFRCIADRCRHSCCVGWEIDIDDDTAARYARQAGALGDRLRSAMTISPDGSRCFATDEHERCPFLSAAGLCDIILNLGEEALCRICADHPRFRNDFTTHTEMGLGLCCEAAAELILTSDEPFVIHVPQAAYGDEIAVAEKALLFARDDLFAASTDRTLSLATREKRLLAFAGRAEQSFANDTLFSLYAPLERLDSVWDVTLARLHAPRRTVCAELDVAYEQLLCYFLYRHVAGALDDDRFGARVAFAVHSVRLLRALQPTDIDELCAFARQYSAEIEYSDENLEQLLSRF